MRRVMFLLGSVVLLGVVWWLRGSTDALRFVVPGNAPVLYATTFGNGALLEDWSQQDRRGYITDISDEALSLTIEEVVFIAEANPEALRATNRYLFQDFDYRVQATANEGPVDNSFGVVFRQLDEETYYLFLISSDGFYSVWRQLPGVPLRELSTWIESDAIAQGIGAANAVRVTAQGADFQFYVNGEQLPVCIPDNPDGTSTFTGGECIDGAMLTTLTDDNIPYGKLGVIVSPFAPGQLTVTFDNVVVLGSDDTT